MARVQSYTTTGQKITTAARVSAIIWTGSTSAGDTCILKHIGGSNIWEGRAVGLNTYIGVSFPDHDPVAMPGGLEVATISSGTVYVYLEDVR